MSRALSVGSDQRLILLDSVRAEWYRPHIMRSGPGFSVEGRYVRWALWGFAVLAIFAWVLAAAHYHWWRASLLTALAGATFVVGTLVGFIFSTYDDEASTIGKLKDWLLGAIATITLVKFGAIKPVLLAFALHDNAREFALTLGVAIVFLVLGFFFMYFGRELLFNVPLARKRDERERIETHQASMVTLQMLSAIPSSLLIGIDDAEELMKDRPALAARLRKDLASDDVATFLKQSDDAIRTGMALDWDVVSKNAYLYYYRTYFAEAEEKADGASTALIWIGRALVINPEHVDLTIKQADMLGLLENYRETVMILERLVPQPECPVYVEQWLGYYLLFLPGRYDDAITHSTRYLERFADSNEARRNLACGWARKYCREHSALVAAEALRHGHHGGSGQPAAPRPLDHASQSYREAMEQLALVIRDNPGYAETIRQKWVRPQETQDAGHAEALESEKRQKPEHPVPHTHAQF
jgi:tetratricopeptide (TPR) repeat protein